MRTFDVDPSSTGQLCRYRLLVEPDVLHAPAVGNAVDHDRLTAAQPASRVHLARRQNHGDPLAQGCLDIVLSGAAAGGFADRRHDAVALRAQALSDPHMRRRELMDARSHWGTLSLRLAVVAEGSFSFCKSLVTY